MLARHKAVFNFACIEMRDEDQETPEALCAPEKLAKQVALATKEAQVSLAGENALARYDDRAYEQILQAASMKIDGEKRKMSAFTYLRMIPDLFHPDNWWKFVGFVKKMKDRKGKDRSGEQVERETEHIVHMTRPLVQEAAAALAH